MPIPRSRRLAALRDRLLLDRRFLSFAAAFPLTRMIARRRADALFDLCAGFVYSQILFASVKIGLFDLLREGPQERANLARRLGLSDEASSRLLDAAIALRLVDKRGEASYGLGALGAAIAGDPGITAMVEHHVFFYADLADPIALLRGEKPATALGDYWPYAGAEDPAALKSDQVSAYSRLMALSLPMVAEEVLDAYPLYHHRCLLDVGGGDGVFLTAAAARAQHLKLMLFDLPAVAEIGRERLAGAGLGPRTSVAGGDFRKDDLPRGADVVSLIRVILDHDDADALTILRAARRALGPGGTLLVAEPMVETGSPAAMGSAYFGFYLLAMGKGRPRSPAKLKHLLGKAGFDRISFHVGRRVLRTGILTAHPIPDC
jgi:demethylspheroidene O-methyltransferase